MLPVVVASISIGMGWASVKYFMDRMDKKPTNGNGNGNGNGKYEALAVELQAIKVLLLGVQGQGGLAMELRDLRLSKHDTNNAIQVLQNKVYILEQRTKQIELRDEEE